MDGFFHLSHVTNPTTNGANELWILWSRIEDASQHSTLQFWAHQGCQLLPRLLITCLAGKCRKCLLQTFICHCYWVGGRSKLYSRPHVWFDCLFLRCCWNPKQLPWESSIKWPIYVAFLRSAGAWISWLVEPLRVPGQRYPGGWKSKNFAGKVAQSVNEDLDSHGCT